MECSDEGAAMIIASQAAPPRRTTTALTRQRTPQAAPAIREVAIRSKPECRSLVQMRFYISFKMA
jgi:hypothetical protein